MNQVHKHPQPRAVCGKYTRQLCKFTDQIPLVMTQEGKLCMCEMVESRRICGILPVWVQDDLREEGEGGCGVQ